MIKRIKTRALELIWGQEQKIARQTDRLFAILLLVQWFAAMVVAFCFSAWAWEGNLNRFEEHVWVAIGIGAMIVSLPIVLASKLPGRVSTRYVVAIGQMLMGSLLIHLSGGRIETHFHVFVSLALLAFYRDWKVLVVASAVAIVDHFLRNMFWSRSIFGSGDVSSWRWIEHAAWIVFADVFLIRSCLRSGEEVRSIAIRQSKLEVVQAKIEQEVLERTNDLDQAMKALLLKKDRFRGVFDNAPIGIALVDLDGHWLLVNHVVCDILGYPEAQLLGMDFQTLTHPDDLEKDLSLAKKLLDNEIPAYQMEKRYLHGDGHIVWASLHVSLLRDESDNPLHFIGQIQDISHQRKIERDLKQAKELAENANRSKSEFLANMSHEVRTPMAAILGYSEILLDPRLTQGERDHALQAIRRNGSHLLQIINDILDLSKIEAGRLDLETIPYSPWQIAMEVASALRVRADEQKLRLDTRPVGRVPATAIIDPTRLRQILVNLVSNAIKFSEPGGTISVRMEGIPASAAQLSSLRMEVEDGGIGMTPAQIAQLYVPFQQADTSTTRKFGGTGLGLSITQKLIDAMGGTISVRSQVGKGSCFTVEIPLVTTEKVASWLAPDQLSSQIKPTKKDDEILQGRILNGNILLVEDNPDNQKLLVYHLCRIGLDVDVVENGRIALEKAQRGNYDLVLMDMQMPELDGYGATSSLRKAGYQIPIIALTAHAMVEDREKCLKAGCTDFLTKPVDVKTLTEMLAVYLTSQEETISFSRHDVAGKAIVSEFEGDNEMDLLIRDFVSQLSAKVDQFHSMLVADDLRGIESLAHQLRGSGGMYGYPGLTEKASLIEDAVRRNETTAVLSNLIDVFARLVEQMQMFYRI